MGVMTADMLTAFSILLAAVVFLVTEWIPMEVTALLVLGAVALTGLVSPGEALSGFSNPAVVTVWAVFILSGGLTRTGFANLIGRVVLRLSGRSETLLVVVIMTCAGGMSAIMNNVAVAALLMPVVMDISRSTRVPASRLLLPLAYGSLLGGLTTLIGTPPNILVSEALRENGLAPFTLFDFTPIGLIVFAAGVAFMALVGGRLLPARDLQRDPAQDHALPLHQQYHLEERLMRLRIPSGSSLVGRTLAESRLGTILGLTVVGVRRNGRIIAAPGPDTHLRAGDALIVESGPGGLQKLRAELESWGQLVLERESTMRASIYSETVGLAELQVAPHAEIAGKTISEIGFRARFGLNVVAVRRGEKIQRSHLQDRRLDAGDILLVQGPRPRLTQAAAEPQFTTFEPVSPEALAEFYHLESRSLVMRVRKDSPLVGRTLQESRLGVALGVSVLSLIRGRTAHPTPAPEMPLVAEDLLIVAGRRSDFDLLQGIQEIVLEAADQRELDALESEDFGLMEAMLAPHTTLSGKTLRELNFREKYGLTVLAIWREGKLYRAAFLRDMALRFGDALLLYGARANYALLGREPDFVVLTQSAQEQPHLEKAKISIAVMSGVLFPVMMGWLPIYLAAVIGAAVMVLTRCLTMDEAYRAIEWKGIFLIAGMLPLGTALDATGAARFLANGVVNVAGAGGPYTVMAGLMLMTFMATCVIPTAALVVLMAPIILSTAGDLGVSPYPMMMAMAMCASASFMTPISHPANVMVMGPGGYRFADYIKVGFPLTVVVGITVLLVLPLFWPFGAGG
jgi:di/tricarboxylate transporter